MKQLQHVTTFSLLIALTGLSPVVAEDQEEHQMVKEYNQTSGPAIAP